jgi:hypothetical protein
MADAPKPTTDPKEPKLPHTFTAKELEGKAGDLKDGELGWLKLDDKGNPTGTAVREMPKEGPAARVMHIAPRDHFELMTPSGAPITEQMNPNPEMWDEGMLARNPVPGSPQEHKDKGPAGAYTEPKVHPTGRDPVPPKK